MAAVADKFTGIFLALAVLCPGFAGAAVCYRTQDDVSIQGWKSKVSVAVLWAGEDKVMDQIRVRGMKLNRSSSLNCTVKTPIDCGLEDDGGDVRVLFDGDRMKLISGGLRISRNEDRSFRLSSGSRDPSVVFELRPLSPAECAQEFPIQVKTGNRLENSEQK